MTNEIKEALTHPFAWLFGAGASVGGVLASVGTDPATAIAASAGLVADMSSTLFTALSILAFTIAPNFDWLPTDWLKIAAIVVGAIFVLTLVDKVWESLKDRLGGA